MAQLTGPAAQKPVIDLYGTLGTFHVAGQKTGVRFFSTVASNEDPYSGHAQLIHELKPMRERVGASRCADLDFLLHRALDNVGIATELVPYLKGEKHGPVAFFPAILAVLIPKGFIEGTGTAYPRADRSEDQALMYGDRWKLQRFELEGGSSPFGMLSVYPDETDIIVLDGQHRASAFRHVSGVFEGAQSGIYSAFYQNEEPARNFTADLPVTLIWFESEDEAVEPTFVSRNLFIDVNSNAQAVSESRSILLNDREAPSLMTRFFFSEVAKHANYDPGQFSLLHGAFDIDTDLAESAGHAFTLTNPAILHYTLSWLLFGTAHYDDDDRYRVKRDDSRSRTYTAHFGKVFDGDFTDRDLTGGDHTTDYEEDHRVLLEDPNRVDVFREEFRRRVYPVLLALFNDFRPLRSHYEASKRVAEWVREEGSTTVEVVWEKVFLGGEGLYYAFRGSRQETGKLKKYLKAIDEIEDRFRGYRAEAQDRAAVDQAFRSMATKAFQVGLLMALRVYRKHVGADSYLDCYEEFIEALRLDEPHHWIHVLTAIKSERSVVGSATPRKWPGYQKLILRIALRNADPPYYAENNVKSAPEGQIFADRIGSRLKGWADDNGYDLEEVLPETIGGPTISKWAEEYLEEITQLFEGAGLEPIEADYATLAREIIEDKVEG